MIWLQAAVVALAAAGQAEPELLEFTAVWCGPCRQMAPTVDRLEAAGCRVRRVDADKHKALLEKFGVSRLPCFIVTADGHEVGRVVGVTSYDRLMGLYQQAKTACEKMVASRAEPPPAMPIRPVSTGVTLAGDAALSQSGWAPRSGNSASMMDAMGSVSDDELIAASVRIRVEDTTGQSCGTGTIIDARSGWALVLTCGHIFRDYDGRGRIEVDLFPSERPQNLEGTLISHDIKNDIGLLRIRTPGPVRAARVAPPTKRVAIGEPVISLGCNNGDPPTARRTRISSMNKYMGPSNIQAGGLPVEGRSGGGLFSADGMVIGVCNCADPKDNEGLYAAADLIRAELDRNGLAFVYQDPHGVLGVGSNDVMLASATTSAANELPPRAPSSAMAEVAPLQRACVPPPAPQRISQPVDALGTLGRRLQPTTIHQPSPPPLRPALSSAETATLEEIARRQSDGGEVLCVIRCRDNPAATRQSFTLDRSSSTVLREMAVRIESGRQQLGVEVVCVISSRDDPNAKSEIIVLDRGSSLFLRGLADLSQ